MKGTKLQTFKAVLRRSLPNFRGLYRMKIGPFIAEIRPKMLNYTNGPNNKRTPL